MQKTCGNPWCKQSFEITDDDLEFYQKISPIFGDKKELIPPPTLCPDCRMQRRLAWRNERNLHRRTCGLCGKGTISSFAPESPYTVYCNNCWWSDRWNPLSYGRTFDVSRPFFEQFNDLLLAVPQTAALQLDNENCEYNHLLAFSKNSYLSPGSFSIEDCFYLRKSQNCRDCANAEILNKCELLTDSSHCDNCSSSHHLINCRNCSSCSFLSDSTNCQDCYFSSGIRAKQYCYRNRQLTKEEYYTTLTRETAKPPAMLFREFQEFNITIPKRAQQQTNCEGSSGDYLMNCHNAVDCTDCFNVEDSKNLVECEGVKDSMDMCMHDKGIELCYEMCSGGESNYMTKFCYCTIASKQSAYMHSCFYQPDCFGCVSLHDHGRFRILNTQYTEEEYGELLPRIIGHMRRTNEWGEYFPLVLSPYTYNQSIAYDHFSPSKDDVLKRQWTWRDVDDEMPKVSKVIPATQLPASIDDIPDDIVNWAIECEITGRPFRMIRQELALYRKMHIPLPHIHPDERQHHLFGLRNPRKLWNRTCGKCGKGISTSYAPERPEIVYCESCYLAAVY